MKNDQRWDVLLIRIILLTSESILPFIHKVPSLKNVKLVSYKHLLAFNRMMKERLTKLVGYKILDCETLS